MKKYKFLNFQIKLIKKKVWRAYTILNSYIFYNIFGADLLENFNIMPNMIYPFPKANMIAMEYNTLKLSKFDSLNPILLIKSLAAADEFNLFHASPIFSNGYVFLGEVDKIIPVSRQRFTRLEILN